MRTDFGSLGITDQVDAALKGRYETPSCLPQWMDTYLNALRMPPQIRRKGLIPDTVSTANHCRYWQRSMETTAGSVKFFCSYPPHLRLLLLFFLPTFLLVLSPFRYPIFFLSISLG
jgi:hypothetical protein